MSAGNNFNKNSLMHVMGTINISNSYSNCTIQILFLDVYFTKSMSLLLKHTIFCCSCCSYSLL